MDDADLKLHVGVVAADRPANRNAADEVVVAEDAEVWPALDDRPHAVGIVIRACILDAAQELRAEAVATHAAALEGRHVLLRMRGRRQGQKQKE